MRIILTGLLLLVSYLTRAQYGNVYLTSGSDGYGNGQIIECPDHSILWFAPLLNSSSMVLTKFDSTRNFLWQKEWNFPAGQPQKILVLPDSGFIVAGSQFNSSFLFAIRFDKDGNSLWTRKYNCAGSGASVNNLFLLSPRRMLLVGTLGFSLTTQGLLFMKFDIDGNNESAIVQDYPGNISIAMTASVMNNDGNIAFCAQMGYYDSYFGIADTNGQILSLTQQSLGITQFQYRKLAQHTDGSYYAMASGPSYENIYLFHLDSAGTVIHQNNFVTNTSGWCRARELVMSRTGAIYLLIERSTNAPYNSVIIRFNDTLGAVASNAFIGYALNGCIFKSDSLLLGNSGFDQLALDAAQLLVTCDSMGTFGCNSQPVTTYPLALANTVTLAFSLTPVSVGIFPASAFSVTLDSCTLQSQYDYCLFTALNHSADQPHQATLYPNPGGNKIFIISHDYAQVDYSILNLSGQTVSSGQYSVATGIDISFLPPGSYFVQLTSSNGDVTNTRFIKE